MFITILIIIIILSLIWLGFLVYRHLPDLKNLDTETLEQTNQGKTKNDILQAKLSRQSQVIKKKVGDILKDKNELFGSRFKHLKNWVGNLESKYQPDLSKEEENKSVNEILAEANNLIEQEDYDLAEKKLIQIITKDKRNIKAYKSLGGIYFAKKDYDQAEEIYQYLIRLYIAQEKKTGQHDFEVLKSTKLEDLESEFLDSLEINPEITICYDHLGEIYEITEKDDKALDCYLKASSISPNNPKYLDKLIALGIEFRDKGLARKALNRLRQINPNNAKLDNYRRAIEKI